MNEIKRIEELEAKVKKLEQIQNEFLNSYVVQGTTNPTINTATTFVHDLGRRPKEVIIIKGNVYVVDVNTRELDVRSTSSNIEFEILVR